jgi:hypothetical protein
MGRDCYRSTWIDITIRDALKLLHDPDEPCGWHYDCRYGLLLNSKTNTIPNIIRGIIFTDTRHLDEMLAVQKVEGKIIRITRPGAGLAGGPGQLSIPDTAFDAVVKNDGTLNDLRLKLREVGRTVLEL